MATTFKLSNGGKTAPRWFRKAKGAIEILTVAANVMIASWGFSDPLLTTRLQLWCTVGIFSILKAAEFVLADEELVVEETAVN
jgi:hypothetical protein